MNKLIVFVESFYQRYLRVASVVIVYHVSFVIQLQHQHQGLITKNRKVVIKVLNGKVGQRHVTKFSGSFLSMLDGEILSSHFEILP